MMAVRASALACLLLCLPSIIDGRPQPSGWRRSNRRPGGRVVAMFGLGDNTFVKWAREAQEQERAAQQGSSSGSSGASSEGSQPSMSEREAQYRAFLEATGERLPDYEHEEETAPSEAVAEGSSSGSAQGPMTVLLSVAKTTLVAGLGYVVALKGAALVKAELAKRRAAAGAGDGDAADGGRSSSSDSAARVGAAAQAVMQHHPAEAASEAAEVADLADDVAEEEAEAFTDAQEAEGVELEDVSVAAAEAEQLAEDNSDIQAQLEQIEAERDAERAFAAEQEALQYLEQEEADEEAAAAPFEGDDEDDDDDNNDGDVGAGMYLIRSHYNCDFVTFGL
eukprot:TRINITY_DN2711_c0_g1_i2.p1 TRINITY_DN2711_c0_g1~~TRINITY_DN2711_c0_g1_i2.p1  ORF type:complete len:337 (+),score=124.15 TRINITY_DN2711_c0_g1_i2:91-1101(+)